LLGFEAIIAHNGFAMAALGISIVFSGLAVLSFAISRLYKALVLWDNRHETVKRIRNTLTSSRVRGPRIIVERSDEDQEETVRLYHMLADTLEKPFALPAFLELAVNRGLCHPYSTVNDLIKQGYIQPDGKGFYCWKC